MPHQPVRHNKKLKTKFRRQEVGETLCTLFSIHSEHPHLSPTSVALVHVRPSIWSAPPLHCLRAAQHLKLLNPCSLRVRVHDNESTYPSTKACKLQSLLQGSASYLHWRIPCRMLGRTRSIFRC